MTIKRYEHNKQIVAAEEAFHGKHHDICICHSCRHRYCPIATLTHDLSETVGRVVVMECRHFDHEEPHHG